MENNSYFDGGILGLIGINILAFLLTLFSFGLAFPWALCLYYSWIVPWLSFSFNYIALSYLIVQVMFRL